MQSSCKSNNSSPCFIDINQPLFICRIFPNIHCYSSFSTQTIRRTVLVFLYSPVLFLLGTDTRQYRMDYQDISSAGRNCTVCAFCAIYQQGLRFFRDTVCISFRRFRRLYPHCWCSMNTSLSQVDGKRFYLLLPVLSFLTPSNPCGQYIHHNILLQGNLHNNLYQSNLHYN